MDDSTAMMSSRRWWRWSLALVDSLEALEPLVAGVGRWRRPLRWSLALALVVALVAALGALDALVGALVALFAALGALAVPLVV